MRCHSCPAPVLQHQDDSGDLGEDKVKEGALVLHAHR